MMQNLEEMVASPVAEGINASTLESLETAVETPPAPVEPVAEPVAEPPVDVMPERAVPIITLPEWFTKFADSGEVKPVKIVIKGVNPDNILIVSYPTGNKLEDGSDEKDVELFKRANKIPALDLPSAVVNIYSNSYRMIQEYADGIWVKAYGLKTNIILSYCINVDGALIPFEITKVKRKEKIAVVPTYTNLEALAEKLALPADTEALELRYKQSKGITATTNMDIVRWLCDKQKDVADINHHLQIDSVIMATVA
jgi:hypothetical protein